MLTEIDALYLEGIFFHKSIHGLWRGFPLSRNFYKRMHVSFTRVKEIEAMYGRSRVNIKVEPCSKFYVYAQHLIY